MADVRKEMNKEDERTYDKKMNVPRRAARDVLTRHIGETAYKKKNNKKRCLNIEQRTGD
ncbi:hypothetical protein O9H85_23810 [Paenibacillus filicis]|uniref:Uncharacterized protein n=1 Tax=Paenibacillus gyeongsangnamensis TaxID=3388067 RepID=A0ABT4QET4_9BACL|nr:hypothetical protein [Paenibacillus filicis]MCZ8515381.1 hypothetical protein [Paenibacillus filicis]